MIFPASCGTIGIADEKPLEEKTYFSTKYLIRETGSGPEIYSVENEGGDDFREGFMRSKKSVTLLCSADEIVKYPQKVQIRNRKDLIIRAAEFLKSSQDGGTKKRCVLFKGLEEHVIFIIDPDISLLTKVAVYDTELPYPVLEKTIKALEETGIFGELMFQFEYHTLKLEKDDADLFPCRACGYDKSLDNTRLKGGEKIAGCLTARELIRENYPGVPYQFINICPHDRALLERPPLFIARCCRGERCGIIRKEDSLGIIVHQGASAKQICDAVFELYNTIHAD